MPLLVSDRRRALAIKRQHFGDRHPSLGPSLNNLAGSLREQGRDDEAAALLEEALAITRQALGDQRESIAGFEVNLGRVHLARHDAAPAEALLRDALRRQKRTLSPGDWRLASTRGVLGASLMMLGRYGAAEPLLVEASRILQDVRGRQGRDAADTRNRLTALHTALGRPESVIP